MFGDLRPVLRADEVSGEAIDIDDIGWNDVGFDASTDARREAVPDVLFKIGRWQPPSW